MQYKVRCVKVRGLFASNKCVSRARHNYIDDGCAASVVSDSLLRCLLSCCCVCSPYVCGMWHVTLEYRSLSVAGTDACFTSSRTGAAAAYQFLQRRFPGGAWRARRDAHRTVARRQIRLRVGLLLWCSPSLIDAVGGNGVRNLRGAVEGLGSAPILHSMQRKNEPKASQMCFRF